MAINDNTSYELTGAQVKDLANKIKGKAADNIFVGATSAAPGSKGLVPQPQAGDETKFLSGDGSWKALTNIFYPVGSIYMSATLATAAAVEAALGGTWVAWGAGRVPVGVDTSQTEFDTAEETGGAKTHTHGLSNAHADLLMDASDGIYYREKSVAQWSANYKINATGGGSTSITRGYGTVLGGSTDSGSNLQPYITCYMYKRTA